jgi:ribonuclease HI
MSRQSKYYVVWEGRAPGIYSTWEEAEAQIKGFPGAKFKAYADQDAATAAFRGDPNQELGLFRAMAQRTQAIVNYDAFPEINQRGIAVDAACSRNPGPVEYQGVIVATGSPYFRVGPLPNGTNNIGEYLAIIHAAALLDKMGDHTTPIYSDSRTAQAWIRAGHSRTKIVPSPANAQIRQLLERADRWLATHRIQNPILKWNTEKWGEIPADFGRK